jgi:GNAT superfamily N-acetyltransferase
LTPSDRLHLNLVDSSWQLFGLDPGAVVEAAPGCLLCAGSHSNPIISNAAFRTDDALDARELLASAGEFFGERQRGFSVWARDGLPEDRDLQAAAGAAGLQPVYAMPEMILKGPVPPAPIPAGAELRQLRSEDEVDAYWKVAAASYASIGFPLDIFDFYRDRAGLLADNLAAFIAYLDGEPASIAMTIVSHRVAGVYWVGSLEAARGKGLGRAVTTAATNAGFELGADVASLQASHMGKPIYAKMGFETVFDYQLLLSPPP